MPVVAAACTDTEKGADPWVLGEMVKEADKGDALLYLLTRVVTVAMSALLTDCRFAAKLSPTE